MAHVPVAANDNFTALCFGIGNVAFYLLNRCHVDKRADGGAGLGAWSDLELCHRVGQRLDKGVVNTVLYENPVGAHTCLPGIAKLRIHAGGDRCRDVSIVKHDQRSVATQFQRQFLYRCRRLLNQQLSNPG